MKQLLAGFSQLQNQIDHIGDLQEQRYQETQNQILDLNEKVKKIQEKIDSANDVSDLKFRKLNENIRKVEN